MRHMYIKRGAMTKETLIKWMDEHKHTVEWLAEKCNSSINTVRSWRSNRPVPKHAVITIQALMQSDKAKEEARKEEKHTLKLEFSNDEFNDVCDAALKSQMRPHEWAVDRLNKLSLQEMAELLKVDPANITPMKYKEQAEILTEHAAENQPPYNNNVIDPEDIARKQNGGEHKADKDAK